MATQILAQVPDSFKAAFLGTIRSQAVFAVERDDAKLLEARFAPLNADDLQGLGRYEVALRPCLDGVTHSPLTLTTLPLPPSHRDGQALRLASQARYGRSRADVEAALKARLDRDFAERVSWSSAARRPLMSGVGMDVGVAVGGLCNLASTFPLVSGQIQQIATGKFFTPPGISS